jgi:hypothetical protein
VEVGSLMNIESELTEVGAKDRLVTFTPDDVRRFDRETVVPRHTLATSAETSSLFTDDTLAEILDGYPQEWLFALTMGSDPERPEDNERVSHGGASGLELLEAVRRGTLWLNITNIDRVDVRFLALVC